MDLLNIVQPADCSCDGCKSACSRPGWPTPDEAEAMMLAGLSGKLMLDFWEQDDRFPHDVEVLCPANPGYEESPAESNPMHFHYLTSGCVMQTSEGLCSIHESGYKPIECRLLGCEDRGEQGNPLKVHIEVARLWDTDRGRDVVLRWKLETGCP